MDGGININQAVSTPAYSIAPLSAREALSARAFQQLTPDGMRPQTTVLTPHHCARHSARPKGSNPRLEQTGKIAFGV